jgi:uncharacterized delta-60 repeat protein
MRTSFVGLASSSGSGPGAPGAIRDLLGISASQSAVLSWTAPVSNGGSAITNHEFQASLADASGTNDTAFATNIGTGFNSDLDSIAIQSDGKIVVGGFFTDFNGTFSTYITRLNANGTRDTPFINNTGTSFNSRVESIAIQSDGKIVVGGFFTTFNGATANRIIRLNSDGTRDTAFTVGTGFSDSVRSITIQSDGKIVVGGDFTTFNGATVNRIVRLNSDGTRDTAFSTNTGTGFGSFTFVATIAIQSDGKIVVGGTFETFNGATANRIIRLNSDGTRDTAFTVGTGFTNSVTTIAIQSDGKIVVGGFFTTFNSATANRIIRLNSDGTRDTAFSTNTGTGFSGNALSIAIQSDGKIVVGGAFTTFNGATVNHIVRLNSDGTRDTAFSTNTGTGFNSFVTTIAIQLDGKIVVGGIFDAFRGATANRIVRLNSNTVWSNTVLSGSSGTSYTFTGLTDGTSYVFRARAINAIGAGPWVVIASPVVPITPVVTGGTLTSDSTYYYRTFTSNGTLAVSQAPLVADFLVVAGGGGGAIDRGGGGGAGGYRSFTEQPLAIGSYSAVVGAGGSASSQSPSISQTNGTNSTFNTIIATGGGRGAGSMEGDGNGHSGGSGGGSMTGPRTSPDRDYPGDTNIGGSGSPSQGNNGGGSFNAHRFYDASLLSASCGGGGGGAGGVGGTAATIDTESTAGGSGAVWLNGTTYAAGGGGGDSGGGSGSANTGNGGNAKAGFASTVSGAGGSGIVVVRYLRSQVGG